MTYKDELEYIISHNKRNNFIKNLVLSLKGNTLVLFQYVEKHGQILYDMIKAEAGDRHVFFIHGDVDSGERNAIRSIVEKEKDAIIIASYGTYQRGINIKNLHNLVFASPSKSLVRVLQSIGRVLRKLNSKKYATLFDLADDLTWKNTKNHTIGHLLERLKIYISEKFKYRIYKVKL